MTDEDLEAIEKACAEASPAPWRWANDEMVSPVQDQCRRVVDGEDESQEAFDRVQELKKIHGKHPWTPIIETDSGNYGPEEKDRTFIAGARQWVPELLAEVKRLREEIELSRVRWAGYEEEVEDTNKLLDEAGLHVGSNDLSALVRQLIADADNGREALRSAVNVEREACAKIAESGPRIHADARSAAMYSNDPSDVAAVSMAEMSGRGIVDIIAAAIRARKP